MLTPHEIRLGARDSALPGLRVLLDAEQVQELLETRTGESFDGLQRLYIRYKPGMNLLVGYGRYGLVECHAKTFRREDTVKLEKVREKAVQYGDSHGRIVIDDPAIVLAPFPSDAKLSTLSRIFSDRGRRHLARLAGVRRRELALRPLRYKPERRFVGQIRDADGAVASLKTYTDRGLRRARMGLHAAVGLPEVRTPDALAIAPRLRTVLLEWIPGSTLHSQLLDGSWSPADLENIGSVLAALHSNQPSGLPVWSAFRMAQRVVDACASIEMLLPGRSAQLERIRARAELQLSDVDGPPAFLHGDFNAEQVIPIGDKAHILDFDRSLIGPRGIDLATFMSHLELDAAAGLIDRSSIAEITAAVLSGYSVSGFSGGPHFGRLVPTVLLQLAITPFRRAEDNWPEKVGSILDRCEELQQTPKTGPHYLSSGRPLQDRTRAVDCIADAADAALLTRALDADYMSRLLGVTVGNHVSTEATVADRSVRLLKRRPGKRFVVEYMGFDSGDGLVGKVRVKRLDRRSFGVSRRLYDRGFREGGSEPFAVPEPVAMIPELHMSLYRLVRTVASWPWIESSESSAIATRAGRALAVFHQQKPLTDRSHALSDELAILVGCLAGFKSTRPYHASRVQRILEGCRTMVSRLPVHTVCGIHRDFHPDNILVGDRQLYLIDFDLYAVGDPAIDAGNFLAHITEWALRRCGHESALDHVEEAFCRAYLDNGGPADFHRIQALSVLTLARHIHLSTVRVGRTHTTERLIDLCERRLGQPIPAA